MSSVLASGEFEVKSEIEYAIQSDGSAQVEQAVQLTNLVTEKYLERFNLKIEGVKVSGIGVRGDEDERYSLTVDERNGMTSLEVKLPQRLGKNKQLNFRINYLLEEVAGKKGEVWNLSLPRMDAGGYDELQVKVRMPISLGRLSVIDPEPTAITWGGEETVVEFNKEGIGGSAITAVFGEAQVYDLVLNYWLENSDKNVAVKEIVVPSDSDWQRVVVRKMKPTPENPALARYRASRLESRQTPGSFPPKAHTSLPAR